MRGAAFPGAQLPSVVVMRLRRRLAEAPTASAPASTKIPGGSWAPPSCNHVEPKMFSSAEIIFAPKRQTSYRELSDQPCSKHTLWLKAFDLSPGLGGCKPEG